MSESFFFSLRWKLSIVFGVGLICAHAFYTYYAYQETYRAFELEQLQVQNKQLDTATVLSEEAFLILEQIAEDLALASRGNGKQTLLFEFLSSNWEQLQLIWDIENITVFDEQGSSVGTWGSKLELSGDDVLQVLNNEIPVHRIICPDLCFQQVMIPVLGHSTSAAVLSVSQSLADILIKYKKLTGSDIGILIKNSTENEFPSYSFKLTAKTFVSLDFDILGIISKSDAMSRLAQRNERFTINQRTYEIGIRQINHSETTPSAFFVFVNDITEKANGLEESLGAVCWHGLFNLLLSLLMLLSVLWFFLRRVTKLSKAIPLLAGRQFLEFKQQVNLNKVFPFIHDEIDVLNRTVVSLAHQLELVEQIVNTNTLDMLEQNRNLTEEKDFTNRLVNTAPIIVIMQRMNGLIASANKAASEALGEERESMIGKLFDLYLPPSEHYHREQLARLRSKHNTPLLKIEGMLMSKLGVCRDIFWIHAPFYQENENQEAFVLSIGVDTNVNQSAERQLPGLSIYDPITGLGNQRKFEYELDTRIACVKKHGGIIALLICDVLPSNHQQACADKTYLVRSASRLKPVLRSSDRVYFIGNNRFAIILSEPQQRGISLLANKIIREIRSLNAEIDAPNLSLSTGVGIALYPEHGETAHQLTVNAQSAMHHAMKDNSYLFYDHERNLKGNGKRLSEWQVLFNIALERDRFVLTYQPVLDIAKKRTAYFNCRLCIRRDDDSLIQPEEYWLYAEQLDFAVQLERVLVVKAINEMALHNQLGDRFSLSIGLSGNLFFDPDFCSDMAELLNKNNVEPWQLIFEFDESSVLGRFVAAQRFMRRIKEYGCRSIFRYSAVDFSSFFYLKHLPIDFVKIGKEFTDPLAHKPDGKNNLKVMIELAQAFNLGIIADSIDSSLALKEVKKFGVNYLSGDLIGKPNQTSFIQANQVE